MQTVARKNWVPQRRSYVHSGKRCWGKRGLSCLSPDWLTKAVVSGRLVTHFRWRWWRRRRRSSSSPCPLLPKSDLSSAFGLQKKYMRIWSWYLAALPELRPDEKSEQWTVPIFHHGNVLIGETKCLLRSRSGHYFIHDSIIIYKWRFIYPVQLPNLFFYHLVLNGNKSRMLSSFGLETEFACKLRDSMNFCTFL